MPDDYVEIIDKARQAIREYAGDDPDKWWYETVMCKLGISLMSGYKEKDQG
jgi:hypothetical protein